MLQKIQGDPLSHENGSAVSLDPHQRLTRNDKVTFLAQDCHEQRRVDGEEGLNSGCYARDDEILLCRNCGTSGNSRRKERVGGDISQGKVFIESNADSSPDLGGRKLWHESGSQHGSQLLFAAGEHSLILSEASDTLLVVCDDLWWGLGHKVAVTKLALKALDFLNLLRFLFHDSIQRFIYIDISSYSNSNREPFGHETEQLRRWPVLGRKEIGRPPTKMGEVVAELSQLVLPLGFVMRHRELNLLTWWIVQEDAGCANQSDGAFEKREPFFRLSRCTGRVCLRIRLQDDTLSFVRQMLPNFFGNKGHEGMEQPHGGFQRVDQHVSRT
jgi:hypothetical protein